MVSLFSPLQIGSLKLANRVFMAPLTRMRAGPGEAPVALNELYYEQRSSAGLIVTEATQVSFLAQGYPSTPGIFSPAQIKGWKGVTEKVHAKGGKIFAQLWHCGRVSHSSFHEKDGLPLAPSAVKPVGKAFTSAFKMVSFETPREATIADIQRVLAEFKQASLNAKEAG